MPQYFQIGPFSVYFYGVFIALGIISSYLYCIIKCQFYKISRKHVETLYLFSLPLALIGARIYHVLDYWEYYSTDPVKILLIKNGGLGIYGGIMGIFAGIIIGAKLQNISLSSCLNLIFPSLLLGQSIGRIGNFFNHEAYGINNQPVFFYESVLCLSAFIIYLLLLKKNKLNYQIGFPFYLISYGFIRLFTEQFRIDTWKINNIKTANAFSIILLFSGFIILNKFKKIALK